MNLYTLAVQVTKWNAFSSLNRPVAQAFDKEIIKVEKFVITGGKPLHGEVTISGAKNAAVGILPATILAADVCVIENLPDISDVSVSLKILSTLGAQVKMLNRNTYEIDTRHLVTTNVPDDLSRQMRASYYFLGALLSRFGKAQVAMPGGCNLGPRPIDQHLKVFSALGAEDSVDYGMITVRTKQELTEEQEQLKREIYERMNPRRRKFIDRIGYDEWDPFQKPNDPMDIRVDPSKRTTQQLFRGFMHSLGERTEGNDFNKGALDCALGIVNRDERYLGIYEFCVWYYKLLKKEGLIDEGPVRES